MQNISITKTKRSVPKLTHSTYPVIIRKGKEWIKDDHGGYVYFHLLGMQQKVLNLVLTVLNSLHIGVGKPYTKKKRIA